MIFSIRDTPFFHGVSDHFLDPNLANEISKEFPEWDDDRWSVFDSKYGAKKEINNINLMPTSIVTFFNKIFEDEFVQYLSDLTNLELHVDDTIYGGGLNIYPPGQRLSKHIDFNYNNSIGKYRAVNILYFANKDYEKSMGGHLVLHGNPEVKVYPKLNTCAFFTSNNKSIHEVTRVNDCFYRKSISVWYYTLECPAEVDELPHKTLWLN